MGYDLLFQQAIKLHEQGRLDEAENIYRQILETAPTNPDVLNLLGLIAQAKGRHAQAVELFYQAVKNAPSHAPFYFNLGLSLENDRKLVEAQQAYQDALRLNPEFKEACNNLGDIYNNLGHKDQAEKMYLRALELDADYCIPRANLAFMKQDVSVLQKAAEDYPAEAVFPYYLSRLYQQQNNFDKALIYARQADKLSPDCEELLEQLGAMQLATGNMQEAKITYTHILEINPHAPSALINLANFATNADDFDTAENYYKQALNLKPGDMDGHFNYANMLYRQNRLPEALEEYRAAVIIDPERFEISNNLGLIQKDLGEYEEALGLFFNAFLKNPEREEISVNLAETLTLLHHQDAEKALKIAEQWLHKAPDNVFAQHLNAALKGEKCENNQFFSQKLFDHFAGNYDHVLQRIGYQVPGKLREITGEIKGTAIDLGCGTGLVGEVYKTDSTQLIGVDISERSLDQARGKGIYKELIADDVLHFCQTRLKDYQPDIIFAADVCCYIGQLEELIRACRPYQLAFSIELAATEVEDCRLAPTGRYQHNPQYIERLLRENGYTNINQYPLILRQECGQNVKGVIFTAA